MPIVSKFSTQILGTEEPAYSSRFILEQPSPPRKGSHKIHMYLPPTTGEAGEHNIRFEDLVFRNVPKPKLVNHEQFELF